jgi:hypothetical protein
MHAAGVVLRGASGSSFQGILEVGKYIIIIIYSYTVLAVGHAVLLSVRTRKPYKGAG